MAFDKASIRVLRDALQRALDVAVKDLSGITAKIGNATFTPKVVNFKLCVTGVGDDGKAVSVEAENYRLRAPLYGLKPEWLGQTFIRGGQTYKVVGLLPRCRRLPVLIERVPDGRRFKVLCEDVMNGFGALTRDEQDTLLAARLNNMT